MINSHKELVNEVLNWGTKMEFINECVYVTDINHADNQVNNANPRSFVFGPLSHNFGEDYNIVVTYGFTVVDKTTDDVKAVITSEQENMFCVSALDDFINRIADGYVQVGSCDWATVGDNSGVITSINGTMDVSIKRSASYWKVMEQYDE